MHSRTSITQTQTYIHTYILYWLVPTGLFRVNFTLQNYKPSRLASLTFKMASKVFIKFRFLGFGDFKVAIVIEN